uniref:Tn3 family transposase n=1 Tax=Shigella sp. FJ200801 TaxID=3156207 RepID=UPI0033947CFA
MGSCAAPSAKGDDKFITTDYLQQCQFFHASEASARVDDLPVSISAVLMAEACNIGLEPLIRSNVPALTRHR